MAPYKTFTLSENDNPLNRAARRWLKEEKAPAPDYYMHLLNIAFWGLENGVRCPGAPDRDQLAVEEQVGTCCGGRRRTP